MTFGISFRFGVFTFVIIGDFWVFLSDVEYFLVTLGSSCVLLVYLVDSWHFFIFLEEFGYFLRTLGIS